MRRPGVRTLLARGEFCCKNSRDKSGEDVYEIFYRADAANSNARPIPTAQVR